MTQTRHPIQPAQPSPRPARFRLTRRRIVLIAVAILLLNPFSLLSLALLGSSVISRIQNQIILDRFSQPFFETALPVNTVEISRNSDMRYHGAHGCSFVAEREIETSLTQQEIQTHFADIGYLMPHGEPHFMDAEGLARVQINPVDGTGYRYILLLWPESNYITDWDETGCRQQ
jgi:hypothetical protein